jgi:hypothetical protein
MLAGIAGFVLRLLSAGVLDGILARLNVPAAAEGERERALASLMVAEIEAEMARRNAQRDVLRAEQGRWTTALMRPAFAYPLAIYYAAVIADSIFMFEADVAALPSPIGDWSGWIISAIFLSESGERIARTVVGRRREG